MDANIIPKSRGYHPSVYQSGNLRNALIDGKPVFTWGEADRMVTDPHVAFCLGVLYSPFQQVTWTVQCDNSAVGEWVDRQFKRFWTVTLPHLCRSYYVYGVHPGEIIDRIENGLIEYDSIKDFHPYDARPLERRNAMARGVLAGLRLHNTPGGAVDIYPGDCWWFAGDAPYGAYYAIPRIRPAYEPFLEKSGRNGARDSRRLFYKKFAFRGGKIWFPIGTTDFGSPGNPVIRDNQDVAREIVEKSENGGVFTFPNTPHPTDPSKRQWEYEDPASIGDAAGIRDYPKDLDDEISEGCSIPIEVIKAASKGSWSGRAVPFQVFFGMADREVAFITRQFKEQVLRPRAESNFGRVPFEIVTKPLAKALWDEDGPNQGAAGTAPTPDNPAAPPTNPAAPPLQMSHEQAERVKALADTEFELSLIDLSFTGEITDKLGRKRKYVDGVPVAEVKSEPSTPSKADPVEKQSKIKRLLSRVAEVPGAVREKATNFAKKTYAKLEGKYGPTGAKLVMAGMVALLPVPIPGSSLIPIALAEGVKRTRGLLGGKKIVEMSQDIPEALNAESLADLIGEHLAAYYEEMGEDHPPIDHTKLLELAQKLIDHPPIDMSWESAQTKTGGVKAVGSGEHAGRVLYGKAAQKALEQKPSQSAQPAQTQAPVIEAPQEDHPAAGKLSDGIRQSSLSPEKKTEYAGAMKRVTSAMPKQALDLVHKNLKSATFHPDTKTIAVGAIDSALKNPNLTDQEKFQYNAMRTAAEDGDFTAGGAFFSGDLHVDGNYEHEELPGKYSTGSKTVTHEIYAHELGHAIDGNDHALSGTPEWQAAFQEEIGRDGHPLSAYASQHVSEGFAEFARLLYGSDVPAAVVEQSFPKASEFFKSNGLWPANSGGSAKAMPEVFDKRIGLGQGDSNHIDTLK